MELKLSIFILAGKKKPVNGYFYHKPRTNTKIFVQYPNQALQFQEQFITAGTRFVARIGAARYSQETLDEKAGISLPFLGAT